MTGNKRSGVPLVFKVMGALMALMLALVAVAVVAYRNCEDCPKYASMIFEGFGDIQAGMVAPGTDNVRALGCDQAFAIGMDKFSALIEAVEEDGEAITKNETFLNATMVMCKQVSVFTPDGPDCHEVVDAYISGAHPGEDEVLGVIVQGNGSQARHCAAFYSGSGEFLRLLDE